jgi:hypothetical protein
MGLFEKNRDKKGGNTDNRAKYEKALSALEAAWRLAGSKSAGGFVSKIV